MKTRLFAALMAVPLLAFAQTTDGYRYVTTQDGVDVYWKARWADYIRKDQALLRFVNRNAYRVEVHLDDPVFACNGRHATGSGQLFRIRADGRSSGELAGHWWYPCEAGERLTGIEVLLDVSRIQ